MTAGRIEEPVALRTTRGRWLIAVTVLASGMAFLDGTAVNVALPSIGRELDAGLADLQWTLSGYTLTLAGLILLGGSLGDRYGRRKVFLIGVGWFAAASLLCGLAQVPWQLVAARTLQGVGGALVDVASWRLVFFINVPIAAVILVVAPRHVPESRGGAHHGRFDYAGAVFGALGLGGITYALIAAGETPDRADVWIAATVGVMAGVAFVVRERRAPDPMLPPRLFADQQFTGANLSTFAVYAALAGFSLFLVLQLQDVLGYDATAAGAAMLPSILVITLLSPRAGALAERIGPRIPMTVGPLIASAGTLYLVGVDGSAPYWLEVLPGSLLQGLGMATTVAPLTATVLGAAPDSLAGVASGVNNAVARAAQLLAVAALPVAVGLSGTDYDHPDVFTAGYRTAIVVCAVLFALGGTIAWLTIRNDVLEPD